MPRRAGGVGTCTHIYTQRPCYTHTCARTHTLPPLPAVERMVEYRDEPEEAAAVVEPRPQASWPQQGVVEAVKLYVRYR